MNKKWLWLILVILGISKMIVALDIRTVRAETYVEGHIAEDTTWITSGSPYVVINDVTVDEGVRLFIQPGVKIKFGGDFSLTVRGRLDAIGSQGNLITFTSNKLTPQIGDWQGLVFMFATPSIVQYALIEYAVYGVTIHQSGISSCPVKIENCQIQQNNWGIMIHGVYPDVSYSDSILSSNIKHNVNDGICILQAAGRLRISNNEISENGAEGVHLKGGYHYPPRDDLEITSNHIYNNSNSGIFLDGYYDTVLFKYCKLDSNSLYDNHYGIYLRNCMYVNITFNSIHDNRQGVRIQGPDLSSSSEVNLTLNSIHRNNEYGVLWVACGGGIANHNDIFENAIGMEVTSNSDDINADYNYWGDPSGPYHESLNPTGKGNSVGGDGTDLHFIPWEPDFLVPEFSSFFVMSLFMIATLLAVIVYRRKHIGLK
jgi:parallel beta-helix repeat protein